LPVELVLFEPATLLHAATLHQEAQTSSPDEFGG
jgi:hypothetical protein